MLALKLTKVFENFMIYELGVLISSVLK